MTRIMQRRRQPALTTRKKSLWGPTQYRRIYNWMAYPRPRFDPCSLYRLCAKARLSRHPFTSHLCLQRLRHANKDFGRLLERMDKENPGWRDEVKGTLDHVANG